MSRGTLRDRWVAFWHRLPPFRGRLAIARVVGERLLTNRHNPLAYATLPNGYRLKIDLRWRDYDTLYYFRTYEPALTSLIRRTLEFEEGSFVDVGANVGFFSMAMADILRRRRGRALAIEPLPDNFAFLCESIRENGLEETIVAVKAAAGDREGTLDLWQLSTGAIANALPLAWRGADQQQPPDAERVAVPMATLDVLVERHRISNIRFIKIDVEGAERFVLEGARKILARDRPLVYTEMHRAFSAANASTLAGLVAFADSNAYDVRYLMPDGSVTVTVPDVSSQSLDAVLVPR